MRKIQWIRKVRVSGDNAGHGQQFAGSVLPLRLPGGVTGAIDGTFGGNRRSWKVRKKNCVEQKGPETGSRTIKTGVIVNTIKC